MKTRVFYLNPVRIGSSWDLRTPFYPYFWLNLLVVVVNPGQMPTMVKNTLEIFTNNSDVRSYNKAVRKRYTSPELTRKGVQFYNINKILQLIKKNEAK